MKTKDVAPAKCEVLMLKGKRKVTVLTERGEIPLIVDVDRRLWKGGMVDGKRVNLYIDPIYTAWRGMFQRAYKMQHTRPGYIDVIVCDEWFRFSNFDKWCEEHFIEGAVLDKDLRVPGSKIYSPNTCCFVPDYVNTCLSTSSRSKRTCLFGVHIRKADGKISSSITKNSRKVHLGYFNSEEDAHFAWLKAKALSIQEIADRYCTECSYFSQEVYESLINRAEFFSGFAERKEIYEEKENGSN